MTLIRATDTMVQTSQLRPNALWESWLFHIAPFFCALFPWHGYEQQTRGWPSEAYSPDNLLAQLYQTKRRRDISCAVRSFKELKGLGAVSEADVGIADPENELWQFMMNSEKSASKILFILANVGFGKTTFLHHYFRVWLPSKHQLAAKMVAPIFLDGFRFGRGSREDVCLRIHLLIRESLLALSGVTAREDEDYECLKLSVPDLEKDNLRRLQALAASKEKIVIVMDNLDQLPSSLVNESMNVAFGLLVELPKTVVLCSLRGYSLSSISMHDAIQSMSSEALFLGPPDLYSVISRRLEFTVQEVHDRPSCVFGNGFKYLPSKPADFIRKIGDVLLDRETVTLIEQTSAYNLRLSLQKVVNVFSSPFIKTEKVIFGIPPGQERASFTKNQMVRTLVLCRAPVFQPQFSSFINVFDNNERKSKLNNLVRLHLLHALRDVGAGEAIETRIVVEELSSLGHEPSSVASAIKAFILAGVLDQCDAHPSVHMDMARVLELWPTQAVSYYRDVLSHKFDYVQWVCLATLIHERYEVMKLSEVEDLRDRIWRAAALVHHLATTETSEKPPTIPLLGRNMIYPGLAGKLHLEIESILGLASNRTYLNDKETQLHVDLLRRLSDGAIPDVRSRTEISL